MGGQGQHILQSSSRGARRDVAGLSSNAEAENQALRHRRWPDLRCARSSRCGTPVWRPSRVARRGGRSLGLQPNRCSLGYGPREADCNHLEHQTGSTSDRLGLCDDCPCASIRPRAGTIGLCRRHGDPAGSKRLRQPGILGEREGRQPGGGTQVSLKTAGSRYSGGPSSTRSRGRRRNHGTGFGPATQAPKTNQLSSK